MMHKRSRNLMITLTMLGVPLTKPEATAASTFGFRY